MLFRAGPAGVLVWGGGDERPVFLQPAPLPLYPGESLVGQVCLVALGGQEGFPYGPLLGGGHGQTAKAVITPSGSTTSATLKP